jgi:ERCC4-type nuclease
MTRSPIPAELSPEALTAIVDTREQTPWRLDPLAVEIGTLDTGDYSLKGLEHVVRIERKSLGDLVSCVGPERERFDREVQRLLAYPVRALIVEATWTHCERGGWRSAVKPQAVVGSLLGWIAAGLPVILAGDHERAGRFACRILYIAARRRWREARSLAAGILEGSTPGAQEVAA